MRWADADTWVTETGLEREQREAGYEGFDEQMDLLANELDGVEETLENKHRIIGAGCVTFCVGFFDDVTMLPCLSSSTVG